MRFLSNEVSRRCAVWIVPSAISQLGVVGAVLGRETQESGTSHLHLIKKPQARVTACEPKRSFWQRRLWESRGA